VENVPMQIIFQENNINLFDSCQEPSCWPVAIFIFLIPKIL
jgi:hypothetical protein